jgi:hypothetical protein
MTAIEEFGPGVCIAVQILRSVIFTLSVDGTTLVTVKQLLPKLKVIETLSSLSTPLMVQSTSVAKPAGTTVVLSLGV